jgi:nucleoside-diphosphate-sugar epimerase
VNLFVFGLGYSAMHYVTTRAAGKRVAGTVRSREKVREIGAAHSNIETLIFDAATAGEGLRERLTNASHLLVSIPPGESGDPTLAHFRDAIESAPQLEHIVYLSTIGVYGDHNGAWVDEDAPTEPSSARNRARVMAEREWLALGAHPDRKCTILRLAGIYGPGRNALVNDIARAIEAAFAPDVPAGIFNVTDDEPAPPQDVIAYAAGLLDVEAPPEIPFESADLTPMARSFYSSNKRVANRRLKEQLGVVLAYPTYRHGLRALAAEFQTALGDIISAGPRIS